MPVVIEKCPLDPDDGDDTGWKKMIVLQHKTDINLPTGKF
jgi:hypothetical protein